MAKTDAQKRLHDFYNITPDAPIYKKEFWYFTLERWTKEGYLLSESQVADYDAYLRQMFDYNEPAHVNLENLGWCEAAFEPVFEEKILEERGDHELVQDFAGR